MTFLPRFARRDRAPMRLAMAALVVLAGTASAQARAAAPSCTDIDNLMTVEQAFDLQARAVSAERIELRWTIAPGCYLYRHQLRVQADAGFAAGELQVPAGEAHEDKFFGRVETYRTSLTAVLPGNAQSDRTTLKIRYQGCADAGICYPPQTRSIEVALPAAATATGPVVPFGPAPVGAGATPRGGLFGTAPGGQADALPLPPEQAFGFEAIVGDGNTLLLRFTPAPGYYLYRDRTSFRIDDDARAAGVSIGAPRWPAGRAYRDEHFGDVIVFFDPVDVPLPLQRAQAGPARVELTASFQGCQDEGICYPPMTRSVALELPAGRVAVGAEGTRGEEADLAGAPEPASRSGDGVASTSAGTGPAGQSTPSGGATAAPAIDEAEDSRLARMLSGQDRGWALLSFFGFGLLLAFTPCVLPMIPILSGLIAGHGPNLGAGRALSLSFVYVLANALVFTAAGVVAGLAGANLQAAFQAPWVLVLFAALFVALALASFGLYELQLPAGLRARLGAVADRQRGGSWTGVAVMGALSALIVGPCVAPPLAAAVLYIGQTRDPVFGGGALFLLAMGMGAPLLAFGVAAGRGLPRSGPWMVAVQRVFGFVFLGLAVWMLSRIVPPAATLALWGALLLGGAAMLALAVAQPGLRDGVRALGWTTAALVAVAGLAQVVGAMAGSRDPLRPLAGLRGDAAVRELPFRRIKSVDDLDREIAAAKAAGKPLLLDFYADWCVACKEMEHYTFPEPAVHEALADFVLLKADVTANDNVDQALMKRLGIIGPPATLYYVDGRERRELRLFGFEPAKRFSERARRAAP